MTRPTKVKVLYQTYDIKWYTDEQWAAGNWPAGNVGMTSQDVGLIVIKTTRRQEDYLRETLVHELLHACLATSMAQHHIDSAPDKEEFFVATQAPVLLTVFRENPKIRKYLFEEK